MASRANTSWSLHLVTNLTLFIYRIPDHVIGGTDSLLAKTMNTKSIATLYSNRRGVPYDDNLCLFPSLAKMRQIQKGSDGESELEIMMPEYSLSYLRATNSRETGYSGIAISDLDKLKQIFRVSVNV